MNIRLNALLAAAAIALSANALAADPIKVAVTAPLTGGSSPMGVSLRDGIKQRPRSTPPAAYWAASCC